MLGLGCVVSNFSSDFREGRSRVFPGFGGHGTLVSVLAADEMASQTKGGSLSRADIFGCRVTRSMSNGCAGHN